MKNPSYYSPLHRKLEQQRRRRRKIICIKVILTAAAVCGLGFGGCALFRHRSPGQAADASAAPEETVIADAITVEGIPLEGLSRGEALNQILRLHPWSMSVSLGEKSFPLDNLYEKQAALLLDEICTGSSQGDYQVDMSGLDSDAAALAAACSAALDTAPQNGGLSGYDQESGSFVFSDGTPGFRILQDRLAEDILKAISAQDYSAVITARTEAVSPELDEASAREQYKTLASFTTTTTANEKRNTNVRLAAEALNGTIVRPGEEFSFNKTVGERTPEKGYQMAAAYNSGAVVQEVGGGVCQMSSTLYRTVFQSGMQISFRRSHTFEPNYVTPGQDATISWTEPDFRFINTSKAPIGIRASYSDRKASVSIYGIPVLEDGVTWDLYSEKVEELDAPEPQYEEDQTLEPGAEVVKSQGTQGSKWVTYKVVYQNGKEIERVKDHEKTYLGHASVILRNTSGTKLAPEETTPAETPAPTIDGMPEDYVPGQSQEPLPEESAAGETQPSALTTGASSSEASDTAPAQTTEAAPVPQTEPSGSAAVPTAPPSAADPITILPSQ